MRWLPWLAAPGATLFLILSLPACPTTANIDDVYMALDGEGNRKRNVFYTDSEELHCVVEVGSGRADATVFAVIRATQLFNFVTGKYEDVDRVQVKQEFVPQPGNTLQKLDLALRANQNQDAGGPQQNQQQPPLPVGRFQCEAYLDGVLKQTVIFNIQFPDCPSTVIVPTSSCARFYEEQRNCPAYGADSTEKASCQCDYTKGWQCQL